MTRRLLPLVLGAAVSIALVSSVLATSQLPSAVSAVAIDADDIGGVVTGPAGPEAGVWVIAETRDLAVRYIKTVVTDDRGRFVLPDLPKATYTVWARGYGLVDSDKVTATPGQRLGITAVVAPSAAAAAHYYPAIYWYAMLDVPAADRFGGAGAIPARVSQRQWISAVKNTGCVGCHQLGQLSTRTLPAARGTFATGADAGGAACSRGNRGNRGR